MLRKARYGKRVQGETRLGRFLPSYKPGMRLLRLRFSLQIHWVRIGSTIGENQCYPWFGRSVRGRGVGRQAVHEDCTPGLSFHEHNLRRIDGFGDLPLE